MQILPGFQVTNKKKELVGTQRLVVVVPFIQCRVLPNSASSNRFLLRKVRPSSVMDRYALDLMKVQEHYRNKNNIFN